MNNTFKQQEIYDIIRVTDNKDIWSYAGILSKKIFNDQKEIKKLQAIIDKFKAPVENTNVTDEELRQKLRSLLLAKLGDQSLSAPEIAQLKDIFGLTNAKQDVVIEIVSYKEGLDKEKS